MRWKTFRSIRGRSRKNFSEGIFNFVLLGNVGNSNLVVEKERMKNSMIVEGFQCILRVFYSVNLQEEH